ncbi:MAG TPA: MgtC/SapB family protein [Thermoanaerobaculia bacterium]|nr:MgtC/SapB family protein [Thermoanaerobaculia bacterium]
MIELQIVMERVALAALFGALIGIEREWRHKAAGIKTNMLVSVGAAAFAMLSNTFGPDNHNPAQMAAAVITGIGFIGAGVIIHREGSVQGVTTAATLWANAAMSAALGLGQYWVGVMLFAAMLCVQFLMRQAVHVIAVARRRHVAQTTEVRVACDPGALATVSDVWRRYSESAGIATLRRTITRRTNEVFWCAAFSAAPARLLDLQPLEEELVGTAGVRTVDVRLVGAEEE